ncbi:MAG: archease [archaeon]
MKESKFIELEHTADIKYSILGKSLNELFENSALAFSSYISGNTKINKKLKKEINLNADNKESLLYGFIDELIYLLDAENFAVSSAKIKISKDEKSLSGVLLGDLTKNNNLKHVKAATYAEMFIKKSGKSFSAQIVLDI